MGHGDGRPVVLTALGSGEKIFALIPLAILSVASVAGLAANGDDDPAASRSPVDAGTAAAPVGHQTAPRQAPADATPTSARVSMSQTAAPVVTGDDTIPETVEEPNEPVDEPTEASPRAEPPAQPTQSPAEAEPPPPAPTQSPTTPPDTTEDNLLTRTEATLQCLESGISTLDVVGLAACVNELLG